MRDWTMESSIFTPLGIDSSHSWREIGALMRFIEEFDIKTFVELGVHKGGLASLMVARTYHADFIYLGVEAYAFDIDKSVLGAIRHTRNDRTIQAMVLFADVFSEAAQDVVLRLINASGKTLIYCDNGNKSKEVELYHKLLKPGDFILAHDYPKEFTQEDFVHAKEVLRLTEVVPDLFEQTHIIAFKKGRE